MLTAETAISEYFHYAQQYHVPLFFIDRHFDHSIKMGGGEGYIK